MANEVRVTQLDILAELEPNLELDVTQLMVLAELATDVITVTQLMVLAEISSDVISVTQFMVLAEIEEVIPPMAAHFNDVFNSGKKSHALLPDDTIGYQLDEGNSFWSIIVPEATANLIGNPSFENGTTGYSFSPSGWASHGRVTDKATGGFYSYKMVPLPPFGSYIYYTYSARVAGWHTFSLDLYHHEGQTFYLQIVSYDASTLGICTIVAKHTGWARYSITYFDALPTPGPSNQYERTARFISDFTNSGDYPIYTDRWQVEEKTYPTTYCDGDMAEDLFDPDPYAYGWEGRPHESISVRSATTFGGGRAVSLYDLVKFKTTGVVGLGLGDPMLDLSILSDGTEIMRGYQQPGKDFSIIGKIFGKDTRELQGKRLELLNLLNQARRRGGQMLLRYQPVDYHGRYFGIPLDIKCAYAGGMAGNYISHYQETIELKFRSFDGRINEEFGNVQALECIRSFENGNAGFESGAIERDPLTGEWSFLANTANVVGGDILCGVYLADGRLVVGGSFTAINGVTAHRIALYTPSTGIWRAIGPVGSEGFDGNVYTLAIGRGTYAGYIIAGGAFTHNSNSTINLRRIAYWTFGTIWTEMIGLNGVVNSIAVDSYSNIHAGGDFTLETGGGNALRYAIYVPGAAHWTSIFIDMNGEVYKVLLDNNDVAYLGGLFTRIGISDDYASHIISYDHYNQPIGALDPVIGSFFAPDQAVTDMAFAPDGTLHICGSFTKQGWYTTVGPDVTHGDCFYVARWNGARWEDYGSHVVNARRMNIDKRGIIYVTSNMVGDNEYLPDTFVTVLQAYNGASWFPYGPRAQNSSSPVSGEIVISQRGKLLICYGSCSEVMTPGHTLVNYPGSLPGKFILRIHAVDLATLHVLSNWTTGQHIYFRDVLVYNDDLYLDLTGVHARVYTLLHGDITNAILLGISDIDNFALAPGNNHITLMLEYDTGANVSAFISWKNQHATIDVASQ